MKILLLSMISGAIVYAQSFYVLTGVKEFDPLVSSPSELVIHNEEIRVEMLEMAKNINVDTANHPSRVLAFLISKVSIGDSIGYKINLELGEYMKRDGKKEGIFALSYVDSRLIGLGEDLEDDLMDSVEEMLSKFSYQYKDDNKDKSHAKVGLTHENFAEHMGYETDYKVALSKAKKEGKELFVFMSTSYCPWCRKLENRMLSKTEIHSKIKAKYIPLMLNFSKKNFPNQLKEIALTPTLYMIDPKTEKIVHQFVGYSNREGFLEILKEK